MSRSPWVKCLSVAFLLGMGGCASSGPDIQVDCPKIKTYSSDEDAQIKKEKNALAPGAYLRSVLLDYEALRDESTACATAQKLK